MFTKMKSLTVALAAVWAGFGSAASAEAVPMIHGFMDYSDEWLDDGSEAYAHYGFYAFHADGSDGGFSSTSPSGPDNNWATEGAVFADGKYYCYAVNGTWSKYSLVYRVIDAESWATTVSNSFTYTSSDRDSEESQRAYLVPTDLTYDAVHDVIYASVRRGFGDMDTYLCEVNRATGELKRVVEIPQMASLTSDSKGVIYGFGIDGTLYTIDPAKGATEVAHTGLWPSRTRQFSATTDYLTDKMYWSFYGFTSEDDWRYNRNGVKGMVEVNPATAECELLWSYPRGEVFTSVNVLNAHPLAPAEVADLSFEPESFASASGVIKCTVPTITVNGTKLSGSVTVRSYVDSKQVHTATLAPGATYSARAEGLADGEHTAAVEMEWNGHTGIRSYVAAYMGFDVPAAVSNLKLTADAGRTVATVSWDAPTVTEHGCPFPTEALRYRVVRYPGEVTVKRSLSEPTFSETITDEYSSVRYVVTPYHVDYPGEYGQSRTSNQEMLGTDLPLPYSEAFGSSASWYGFTCIDGNDDSFDNKLCWCYDDLYYCAFYYGLQDNPADDWLITPPMQLDPNKLYRLTFKWYGYYGYGNTFEVAVGPEATADVMSRGVVHHVEAVSSLTDQPGNEVTVDFAVAPGDRFVGFHNITTTMEHLSIDDIRIEECGDSRVPDRVTEVKGERVDASTIKISFTMPSYTCAGLRIDEAMTARVYRSADMRLMHEAKGLKGGARVEWVDKEPVKGVNTYVVVAENSIGEGLDTEVTVDMSDATPGAVTNVKAAYVNDRQVRLSWDAYTSTVGANGNPVNPEEVRYMVYKAVYEYTEDGDAVVVPLMVARDLDATSFDDMDAMAGLDATVQQAVQYYVCAVNGAGEGEATAANAVIMGPAYSLPFAETWYEQTVSTNPWFKGESQGANWYVMHQGYDPMAAGQDGYGVLSCEDSAYGDAVAEGSASVFTPRIDFSTMTNPVLTFWFWRSPEYDADVYLQVGLDVEGAGGGLFATRYYAKSDNAGWEQVTVNLSQFAQARRVSVMLRGFVRTNNHIHVDNLRIEGSAMPSTLRVESLTGATTGREGEPMEFTAVVHNLSDKSAAGVKLALNLGSEQVASATVPTVAAGGEAEVALAFTPTAAQVGSGVVSVQIVEAGGLTGQSVASALTVEVKKADKPCVSDLRAVEFEGDVTLTWGIPSVTDAVDDVVETFEAYDAFDIAGVGAWTLTDMDGLTPFAMYDGTGAVVQWPNYQDKQAFIVFNNDELQSPYVPYSGSQMMCCFSSPYGRVNDWLISPQLSGEQQLVSFMAASMAGEREEFNIMLSTTDNRPESFLPVNGTEPYAIEGGWTLYHFNCPAGTRYFAINVVSDRKTALMIDDVHFRAAHRAVRPESYNVYRNGVKVNSEPVTERYYMEAIADRSATYTVRAVYGALGEGGDSNRAAIEQSGLADVAGADGTVSIAGVRGGVAVGGACGLDVEVLTVAGVRVARTVAESDSVTVAVAPGLYVVRAGGSVAKVVVK